MLASGHRLLDERPWDVVHYEITSGHVRRLNIVSYDYPLDSDCGSLSQKGDRQSAH